MTIGERIKNRRKELGLTVDELAQRLGKNRATVYRYESNDIEKLPTTVLEPLAKALDVTPAYLMGWKSSDISIKKIPYNAEEMKLIPLVGKVAAGYNCHAEENITEYIRTDADSLKTGYDYFWLEVKGDSMEHMSFHDLRHLNASIMVLLGVPDKYAMERGGWSSTSVLKSVYQHTFSDERKAVDERIDKYFNDILDTLLDTTAK